MAITLILICLIIIIVFVSLFIMFIRVADSLRWYLSGACHEVEQLWCVPCWTFIQVSRSIHSTDHPTQGGFTEKESRQPWGFLQCSGSRTYWHGSGSCSGKIVEYFSVFRSSLLSQCRSGSVSRDPNQLHIHADPDHKKLNFYMKFTVH
jgi:hypothetical protein